MGFFDSVTPTAPTTGGGFFASVKAPTPEQASTAIKVDNYTPRNAASTANDEQQNSFMGQVKNFVTGLPEAAVNEAKSWPGEVLQQSGAGVQQFEQGMDQAKNAKNPLEETEAGGSELSGGLSIATAGLAPALAPIGKGVSAAGTAIGSNPAVIKAVQAHPNIAGGVQRAAQDIGNTANVLGAAMGGAEADTDVLPTKKGFFSSVTAPGEDTPVIEKTPPSPPPASLDLSTLVDSTGKHDLRTAMTGLNEGGYSAKQIATIMGKVIENNNSGRFTPKEISAVARTIQPENPTLADDSTVIKTTSGKPVTPKIGAPLVKPTNPAPDEIDSVTPAVEQAHSQYVQSLKPEASEPKTTPVSEETKTPASPTKDFGSLRPVVGEGEKTTSTLATKVDAQAVANNLKDSGEELPSYMKTTWEAQGKYAADIVDADADKAIAMWRGEEPTPPWVLHNALGNALEDFATKTQNHELIDELTHSPRGSLASTRAGQEIGVLSQRNASSPVRIIQDVENSRTTEATPAKVSAEVDNIKSEVAKVKPTKQTWSDFVDSIAC